MKYVQENTRGAPVYVKLGNGGDAEMIAESVVSKYEKYFNARIKNLKDL